MTISTQKYVSFFLVVFVWTSFCYGMEKDECKLLLPKLDDKKEEQIFNKIKKKMQKDKLNSALVSNGIIFTRQIDSNTPKISSGELITAFKYALKKKNIKDMVFFLENTDDWKLAFVKEDGCSPLLFAVQNFKKNNLFKKLIKLLLEKGAPISKEILEAAPAAFVGPLLTKIQNFLVEGDSWDWSKEDKKKLYQSYLNMKPSIELYLIAFYAGNIPLAKKLETLYEKLKPANSIRKFLG